jgi:hypothetical protein
MSFRAFHAAIAVEQLLAIAYVWWCALSGRRDRLLRVVVATLIGEGVLVIANRGDWIDTFLSPACGGLSVVPSFATRRAA